VRRASPPDRQSGDWPGACAREGEPSPYPPCISSKDYQLVEAASRNSARVNVSRVPSGWRGRIKFDLLQVIVETSGFAARSLQKFPTPAGPTGPAVSAVPQSRRIRQWLIGRSQMPRKPDDPSDRTAPPRRREGSTRPAARATPSPIAGTTAAGWQCHERRLEPRSLGCLCGGIGGGRVCPPPASGRSPGGARSGPAALRGRRKQACAATIRMTVVLPHPGVFPNGPGVASSECSRRCNALSSGER
jgi:hypothetical protein